MGLIKKYSKFLLQLFLFVCICNSGTIYKCIKLKNDTKNSFLNVHNIIKSLLLEKLLCCDVDIALHLFVADTSLNTGEIDTLNY